jgi:hypothetical protein
MDHITALRTMAVEKYLLDELDGEEKEAFEDHFFSCQECAQEIKTGAALMQHAREGFQREEIAERPIAIVAAPPRRNWLAWLRPSFLVPAMALMLGVVVFQNLVQFPTMHASLVAMNEPSVLPYADLKSGSSRGDRPVVDAKPGEIFQLTLDIPDSTNGAHIAELDDAAGRKLWSIPVPADAPKDGLALKMPGTLQAGDYTLLLKQDASGAPVVSRYSFELKRS